MVPHGFRADIQSRERTGSLRIFHGFEVIVSIHVIDRAGVWRATLDRLGCLCASGVGYRLRRCYQGYRGDRSSQRTVSVPGAAASPPGGLKLSRVQKKPVSPLTEGTVLGKRRVGQQMDPTIFVGPASVEACRRSRQHRELDRTGHPPQRSRSRQSPHPESSPRNHEKPFGTVAVGR